MRRTCLLFPAACLAAVLASSARDAQALGPVDVEIAAKAGAGSNPFGGSPQPPNPLGFGVGGRGGVSIFGFYGGVNVLYYLGSSETVLGSNVSFHSLQYGPEIGYNIKLAILTIRPQVGFGNYTLSATGVSDKSNFYLEPGVTALISLGTLFLGADANALVLTGVEQPPPASGTGTNTAFTMHGQIGLAF